MSDKPPSHMIHPNLADFAIPIDAFDHLPSNPRKGNVAAIAAALDAFGQVKPIVAREKDDGRYEVLAGNHTLDAARHLQWTHLAAVILNVDATEGLAYAISDNRTVELGATDEALLYDALGAIIEDYADLMEELGWDEFELAVLDGRADEMTDTDTRGYVAPVVITPPADAPAPMSAPVAVRAEDGEVRLEAPAGTNVREAVAAGSTAIGVAGDPRAVIQYTITFDTYEQQRRWYEFMRWLRESSAYAGDTNVERLLDFAESHADF